MFRACTDLLTQKSLKVSIGNDENCWGHTKSDLTPLWFSFFFCANVSIETAFLCPVNTLCFFVSAMVNLLERKKYCPD